MRISNQSNNTTKFKGLGALAKPLGTFYDANAVLPTLLIETGVTLGRSYEANKRGGRVEATERFVEQGVSAVVWLWGVQVFQKIGEFLGKKLLNIKDLNFDVGRDALRNPIKNNGIDSKIAAFKAGNILTATALATVFIGFILPKINHLITNRALKKGNEKENKEKTQLPLTSIEQFKNNVKKDKNISFASNKLVTLAHTLENNSTARLLITDSGVISGRCYNARNKYERIENLFRDTASVYFYLLAPKHFAKLMNKLTSTTDINPKALESTMAYVKEQLDGASLTPDEFIERFMGKTSKEDLDKLNSLFKDKETVSLADFTAIFKEHTQKASKMSELQPFFEKNPILSYKEAKDVLNSGMISDPDFLKGAIHAATKGVSDDELKYISQKKLEGIRASIDNFISDTAKKAKAKNVQIDAEFINQTANKNTIKSLIYQFGGVAFAAAALGLLIPKVQYAITRYLTHKNEFPGTKDYQKN